MPERPACDRCRQPLADLAAYVCHRCTASLAAELAAVPGLLEEVPAARWRQVRYGDGGDGGWQPPWDQRAADAEAAATNALTTWARHVAEERGVELSLPSGRAEAPATERDPAWMRQLAGYVRPVAWDEPPEVPDPATAVSAQPAPDRQPAPRPDNEHPAAAAAAWLAQPEQLRWLQHRPEAAEAHDELRGAVRELRGAVDRPADRWWAGPCGAYAEGPESHAEPSRCPGDVWATPGAQTARCVACGAAYDTTGRRAWLLDAARDTLTYAEHLARALTGLGQAVTPAQVRGYARHGRIAAHGHDQAGRPLYRVGDVLAALELAKAEEQARQDRRDRKAARRTERTQERMAS